MCITPTHALGLPQLREAIAHHYHDRYHIDVEPDRIVITAGTSGALLLALGILINPSDEVLLAERSSARGVMCYYRD